MERTTHRLLIGTAFCTAALMGTDIAAAQTTSPDDSDSGEIIVTAQRREQSVQDVGIAISVVSADELSKRGITNVNQLQNVTSNLEVEPAFGGGTPQFRVRGIGFQDYASNNSPTVGIYVNEVAYPVPVMTQGLIFDVSRVEVLKGPQGTLYGRNTTGGAINFITNKPNSEEAGGGATIEYGRFDALQAEAYVTAPISDGLAFRVAGTMQQGGAFQRNRATGQSLGDADRWGGRFLLGYDKDGSPFTALFDAHYGRDKSESIGLYLLGNFQTFASPAGPPGSGIPPVLGPLIPADKNRRATGWGISPLLVADAGLSPNEKPGRNNSTFGTSLNLGYDLGGVKLTSITSYDKMKRREYGDWDTAATVQSDVYFGSRINVFSQEVRLSSNGDGPLTWVTGLYYSRQKQSEQFFSDFLSTLGVSVRMDYGQTVESIAALGQVEYAVSPKLNLIAGLRYEDETRKLTKFTTRLAGLFTILPPTNVETKMKPLTGKLGAEFKPSENVLIYASASKGVKSGGFTAYNTGNAAGIQPFKEETLYAYETGIKAELTKGVQLNTSAYYYDYRNQQVLDAVCGNTGPVGRFANAKKSRIYGLEGELNLNPAKGLTISQYASYKKGEYKNFQSLDLSACVATGASTFKNLAGTSIPFPKVSYGGTIGYEAEAGNLIVNPSFSYSYRSNQPSWLRLGPIYDIKRYWLANADLTVRPENGRWSASLWGRNIFNKQYDTTRNFFLPGAPVGQIGTPATYGIRLSLDY